MGSMSLMHWVVVVVAMAIYGIPATIIVRRAGYSAWWGTLGFIPLANVVGLWCLAFVRWPALELSFGVQARSTT